MPEDGRITETCSIVGYNKLFSLTVNIPSGAKRTHVFQITVTLFIFNIKIIISTPKQPVINSVLITYSNHSITDNYIGKMASFLPYTRPEPLLKVLHHIY